MEQPNTPFPPSQALLLNEPHVTTLTAFQWHLGLKTRGISQYDYVYTIAHNVESRLRIICHIWGRALPHHEIPYIGCLSSTILSDNCWLCLPFISCFIGLIVL